MFDISIFFNWRSNRWRIINGFSGKLCKNWAWEFNLYATHSWILLDTKVNPPGEGRGLFLMVGLLGFALDINIYDNVTRDDNKT